MIDLFQIGFGFTSERHLYYLSLFSLRLSPILVSYSSIRFSFCYAGMSQFVLRFFRCYASNPEWLNGYIGRQFVLSALHNHSQSVYSESFVV